MSRTIRKFVAVFLALLLGFGPLQSAIAAAIISAQTDAHHVTMSKPAQHHGGAIAAEKRGSQECDRCTAASCCKGGVCVSVHCASCVFGILPTFTANESQSAASFVSDYLGAVLTKAVSTPYRPPRA